MCIRDRYLVLSASEGAVPVKIVLQSEEQAPAVLHIKLRAVKVTPELDASLAQDTLSIVVKPLMVDSRLTIKVYDEKGKTVLVKTMYTASLAKVKTLMNAVSTSEGLTSLKLGLNEAGTYTVLIVYETPAGTATQQLQYKVVARPLLPYTLLIVGLALIAALALILRRRQR